MSANVSALGQMALLPMVSQVVLPPKGFVTDVTCVRPFIRVCALVDKQVVRFGEVPTTELANKFLPRFRREATTSRPHPLGASR